MKNLIFTVYTILLFGLIPEGSSAQVVQTPVKVTITRETGGTMSIPRWKAFMHPQNHNLLWLGLGNWGATGDQLMYSTDSGNTWNSTGIMISSNYSSDYHTSLAGDASGNIYTVSPDGGNIEFTRIEYPGRTTDDAGPNQVIHSTGDNPRANVMVQPGNNRVWVFTRQGEVASENVRYEYTDNGGSTWHEGTADPTGFNNVRIGSMPYVNGNPALVVLYINSTMGYKYYLWNGTAFEEKPDAQIYAGDVNNDRAFTHNVLQGNYFHLVFGFGNNLYHYWKPYNNGTGSWNHSVVDNSPYTSGIDWETTSSAHGDKLYLFYRKQIAADAASAEIIMRVWSQTEQSWSAPQTVSIHPENTTNRHPNTAMQVPSGCDYIPVFWYSDLGSSDYQVYCAKIMVGPTDAPDSPGESKLPGIFELHQNRPNPFNPETTIAFSLPERTEISLDIFDILGRHVKTLADQTLAVGEHSFTWTGTDSRGNRVGSGVYFYRLKTETYTSTKRMVLLK